MNVWMIPGQGSQKPGMAAGLAACKGLFGAARKVTGARLEKMCTSPSNTTWPADLLQPALYTTSVGASQALTARGAAPEAVVGHSLGEFAALTAAGALSYEDGLRLVHVRGKATAAAARKVAGGMAAVIGLGAAEIGAICEETGDVWVANLNSPKQTVISGTDSALTSAAEKCLAAGAMKVIRLQVPIAGHSPLMEPAAEELARALGSVEFRAPSCPFYSCADASPHTDPAGIPDLLVRALISTVRFDETVRRIDADGASKFVEVGPGRVLAGLVRQILPDAQTAGVSSDEEAERHLASAGESERDPAGVGAGGRADTGGSR